MGDTPILEISRLEEIFEDDTAGIADLLEAAMGTGAANQATLRDAVARRQLDEVMRAAHAIKGSTANIGGNEVAALAARIEDAARAQTWDGIEPATIELDQAYERLREAVRAYRAGLS
ncbi:MAG: Hpt domain-containing protein [Candidatus Lustribacter sp.]|jgi:HPt (histidine-containing phosphotransfer) domain-containing protein